MTAKAGVILYCRIGSLENPEAGAAGEITLYCRIGSLEIDWPALGVGDPSLLPDRQLRKRPRTAVPARLPLLPDRQLRNGTFPTLLPCCSLLPDRQLRKPAG